jgi:hypothetical protein
MTDESMGSFERAQPREATIRGMLAGPERRENFLASIKTFQEFFYGRVVRTRTRVSCHIRDARLNLHFLSTAELKELHHLCALISSTAGHEIKARDKDERREKRHFSNRK